MRVLGVLGMLNLMREVISHFYFFQGGQKAPTTLRFQPVPRPRERTTMIPIFLSLTHTHTLSLYPSLSHKLLYAYMLL